ncbi:MAG: translational GTPase TypA, partial [Clostridia bacterium]|nr:translational GTPase TypA [Clostridia bacterium]
VPDEYTGAVMEKLGSRKAEMTNMRPVNQGYTRLSFKIPSRGLIGYRNELLTDTKGTGIMNHYLEGYEPYKGDIQMRQHGSLVSFEDGESITYGLYNAQERGKLFIGPNVKVYEGMVVGENAKNDDINVNVCKKKQQSNVRASGSDDALRLVPHVVMSLENCMEFIGDDELVEITPKNLRIRKRILNSELRAKARSKK